MTGTAKRSQAYAARRVAAGEKRVSLWLKAETLAALQAIEKDMGISREELINKLVADYADDQT